MTTTAPHESIVEAPSSNADIIKELDSRRRKKLTHDRRVAWLARFVVAVVVLGAWQIVGTYTQPIFTSTPILVAIAGGHEFASGVLLKAIGQSLEELTIGLALGILLGIATGLLMGRYRLLSTGFSWLVSALYATPLIAVIPLVVIWFGLGIESKVFIVFILTYFPMLINTASGVREVDPYLLDVAKAFVLSERQIFRKVILPGALPYVTVGLRLAIGRGLLGVVAAEFLTGLTGLGSLIQLYGNDFETAYLLAPTIVLMILGIIFTALARLLERKASPWKGERA